MGVFGVVFGCIGDGGFTLVCISGCRGVVGFNVATSQLPVREKVRPAWSDGGCEREKVRPACEKWPKIGGLWRAGRVFSRKRGWRGGVGRVFSRVSGGGVVPGDFCRTYRHAVSFSGTFGALVTGCARSYPLRNGLQAGVGGGFALHEALWLRVAGVSEPHVVQFPRVVAGLVCVLVEVLAAGPFDWQC